jgi:hypothetical protein
MEGAYFADAFETTVPHTEKSALAIYLDAVTCTPKWIDALMVARNRIVALFGLKDIGRMSDVKAIRTEACKVGDRVGIFSILFLSDDELILGDFDRHLDARVSVCKYRDGDSCKIAASTVVHVNNFLGRAYLFFVVPVHKRIVPVMLAGLAAAAGRLPETALQPFQAST